MEGPNKRYRCWICQQDLSRSVYYRHMRRNGCPALVRMQTKECHTTKGTNTRTSQETSNLSVDMEEESSDMDNVNDRYTLCTEEAEEQPTSAADDLHLEDRNVNVMENADAYQETEVVLDSDYDDLAFDCTGCSTPEGSKTGWFASDDKQFPFGAICLFLNYYQLKFHVPDRGMQLLLSFLKVMIALISLIVPSNSSLKLLMNQFPSSLNAMRTRLSVEQRELLQYVMCPKCDTLCGEAKAVIFSNQNRCSHVPFPNHPHKSRRVACQSLICKVVKFSKMSKTLPQKTYIYSSILKTIKSLITRKSIYSNLDGWMSRSFNGKYVDIYDGAIWNEFTVVNGRPFLDVPYNLGLILNVDWFQPYEHTQYSIGVIYLAILNLPRSERYKLENVIIVGCIPGPKEPSNINPYLKPLVDELLVLWEGITIDSPSCDLPICIRGALLAVSCDVPATRKVCGFSGPSATMGCSKCLKSFTCLSFGEKLDYSGFDRDAWIPRSMEQHLLAIHELESARTPTEVQQVIKKNGVRYSELLRLPYFDIIRQHVTDAMHNMYLGTAKHVVSIWKDRGILGNADFDIIQTRTERYSTRKGLCMLDNIC